MFESIQTDRSENSLVAVKVFEVEDHFPQVHHLHTELIGDVQFDLDPVTVQTLGQVRGNKQ